MSTSVLANDENDVTEVNDNLPVSLRLTSSSRRFRDELDLNLNRKLLDPNLFTFKPKLNPKTQMLTSNLLSFYERQNLHTRKQLEMLEEAYKMTSNSYSKLLFGNFFAPSNKTYISSSTKRQSENKQISSALANPISKEANDTKTLTQKKSNFPLLRSLSQTNEAKSGVQKSIRSDSTSKLANNNRTKANLSKKSSREIETVSDNSDQDGDNDGDDEDNENNDDSRINSDLNLTKINNQKNRKVNTRSKTGKINKSYENDDNLHDDSKNLINSTTNTGVYDENIKLFQSARSKTMPPSTLDKLSRHKTKDITLSKPVNQTINTDRLKMAKEEAERAIKQKKIFTIIGPYPALRDSLRSRGWVEKFENMNCLPTIKKRAKDRKKEDRDDDKDDDCNNADDNNDDTDEDDDDEEKIKPWEENNGYYGILSRLVKNFAASFIWTVRSGNIDYNFLQRDQIINHYNKNGAFTTKIGLCSNLRNLSWFSPQSADEWFPRCFKLSQDEDKIAFIDDYRITCCIGLLKYILLKHEGQPDDDEPDVHITSAEELKKMTKEINTNEIINQNDSSHSLDQTQHANNNSPGLERQSTILNHTYNSSSQALNEPVKSLGLPQKTQLQKVVSVTQNQSQSKLLTNKSSRSFTAVPLDAVEFALDRIKEYVDFRDNNDIDNSEQLFISDEQWSKFYEWFYAACHDKIPIERVPEGMMDEIMRSLNSIKESWPQYNIDGYRNIWIVKPGALSRGRGIIVFDKIENILELNTTPLQKDGRYVVQKYIERPLLIHKIKFDIRQWFLVTDFNPLTIWMYKDCYLRFCTQKFTLDSTQQSVHLCNYSIQKNYKNDAERSSELPEENMWSQDEFIDKYLTRINRHSAWEEVIYPGMKNAILCCMQSTQDIIESRKNTFELYGADFMIGEDLKPWLIEINCSPTMARSTEVTTRLCDDVLEDICKVIIDRKNNRNADTGRFELIYKALPVTVPNYIGIDLKIDGHSCKKPNQPNLQQQIATNNIVPSAGISGSSSNSSSNNNTLSNTKKNNESENLTLTGLEIKTNRNSNFTSTSKSNTIAASSSNTPGATSILTNHSNNSSSSNTTTKLKKEATNASISIANSIQELAQKEVQTQNHLANYHSTYRAHNNLSNISYNYLVNLPEKNKRSNVSSSKEDEQDGGGGAVNTTTAAVNTNTSNFISKLDQPSIKPIKTNPSIPKLFQFPSSITNGSTSSMHGFKASPTLVNAHLASLDSNSFSNQPLGAKLNSNLISNQQQQQQPQQQQQQQQISLSAIPSTIPSNIAKTNKVTKKNKQTSLISSLNKSNKERIELMKKLKDNFSSSSIIFFSAEETTNESEIEESKNLKTLQIKSELLTEKMNPSDKLRNIISIGPRNFSMEKQKQFRKQKKTFENAVLNGYKGCITEDISKLMKKYSIR